MTGPRGARHSPRAALRAARAAVSADPSTGGRVHPVRRLDRPGVVYDLVLLGDERAPWAIAVVDRATGEATEWARLAGSGSPLSISAREACSRGGLGASARAELVWGPSRISRSPLYPFWAVRAGGATRFVDQQGGVWSEVAPGGPGGA